MKSAFETYIDEVENGYFPSQKHSFNISDEIIEKLY